MKNESIRRCCGISLKGCQIVAGGRSVAQTTGKQWGKMAHWRGGRKPWHPSGVRSNYGLASGGLRYAPTTGYFRPNPPG